MVRKLFANCCNLIAGDKQKSKQVQAQEPTLNSDEQVRSLSIKEVEKNNSIKKTYFTIEDEDCSSMQPLENIPPKKLGCQHEQYIKVTDSTKIKDGNENNQVASWSDAKEFVPMTQLMTADVIPNTIGQTGRGLDNIAPDPALKDSKKWKRLEKKRVSQ